MGCLAYVWFLVILATGLPPLFHGQIGLGLAGTLAPFLAITAGGGITTPGPYGGGYAGRAVIGLVLLAVSIWWVRLYGWRIELFGMHISGTAECLIGFVAGLAFGRTDRRRGATPVAQPMDDQS